jgi:glycosyl transferase family 87
MLPLAHTLRTRWRCDPTKGVGARLICAVLMARWINRRSLMLSGFALTLMSAALLAGKVTIPTAGGLTDEWLGGDFICFFSAANAATRGAAPLVYNHRWLFDFEGVLTGARSFWIYPYPPIAILLSLPLAAFSFVSALLAWILIGATLCFWLLRRLVGWREAALAVAGAPATLINIFGGQNGCFTAVLLGGGLMALDRSPMIAGILFGCLAYKPQMGVAIPFALAAAGNWRAFLAAAATIGVLVLATLALFGSASWVGFIDQLPAYGYAIGRDSRLWARMPTVFAAVREAGGTEAFAFTAQIISAVLALGMIMIIWRSPTSTEIKAAALSVATFLVTPYAFFYDAVILIFAAAWLGRQGIRTKFLSWESLASVMLLVLPLPMVLFAKVAQFQIGPIVLWLVLIVLARRSAARLESPSTAQHRTSPGYGAAAA